MKCIVTVFVLLVIFSFVIGSADARTISPFKFEINDYHLHGSDAHLLVQETETIMPIKVKNTSLQPYNFKFHTTLGDQINPPDFPNDFHAKFVPDQIFLEPNEETTLDLIINVDEDARFKLYTLGIVGFWNDSDGFMGSSIKVHVGKYFGDNKISDNVSFGSPLDFAREKISFKDIPCYNDYVAIVKQSNGFPVCVKFDSALELINRGWAQKDESFQYIQIAESKPAYYYGEKISFLVKKISYDACGLFQFKITDEDKNLVWDDELEIVCPIQQDIIDKADIISFELPQNKSFPIILDDVGEYLLHVESSDGSTAEMDFEITTEGFDIFTINSVAGCSNMRLEKLSESEWNSRQDESRPPISLRNQDFKENQIKLSLLIQMLDTMNMPGMWKYVDEKTIMRNEIQTNEERQSNIWNWLDEKWDEQHGEKLGKKPTKLFTHGNDFYDIIWGPIC